MGEVVAIRAAATGEGDGYDEAGARAGLVRRSDRNRAARAAAHRLRSISTSSQPTATPAAIPASTTPANRALARQGFRATVPASSAGP